MGVRVRPQQRLMSGTQHVGPSADGSQQEIKPSACLQRFSTTQRFAPGLVRRNSIIRAGQYMSTDYALRYGLKFIDWGAR